MPTLEEGQLFERYVITRWLGSGVSGESYEAEAKAETLQQKVTLKLLHPWAVLGDSARRQFFREMQGIGRLSHPYLASVLDYGETNGRLYVARRYTSSGSLLGSEGRLWFHPPLSISDAIVYGHQLAQALEHIHNQGYLHGALTFANILVLRGPNVEHEPDYAPFLLADVGLANFVRRFGQPQITLLPITAAPEQLGKRVTPASDQFALAVLVFSWLAGRPPYLGSPEEVEQLKLSETIAPLRSLNPEVTEEQEAVLRRALAVYPEERYPSALAFADALLATLIPQSQPDALTEPGTPVEFTTQGEPDLASEPTSVLEPSEPSPELLFATDVFVPEPSPTFESLLGLLLEANAAPTRDVSESFSQPALASEEELSINPVSPLSLAEIGPTAEAGPVAEEEPSINQEPASPLQADAPPIMPPRFIISSPYRENPVEVMLEGGEITLGRAGSSDILLDYDALTSRHHALLKREGEHYIIYDRHSVSGVLVNGQRLVGDAGQILSDGDHVRIGNYELVFRSSQQSSVH